MATPPTVLANTSSSPPSSPPASAGFPVAPLLISVVVGVIVALLGVGGAVWYLARTGRLPGGRSAAAKAVTPASLPTHVIVLEPLLANLADAGGSAYLRISVALRVADAAEKGATKKEDKADAAAVSEQSIAVRDTALMVLGRQTSDVLLAVDGKERLKSQLKLAFAERNPEIKVQEIYFTDFLVQR